MEKKIELSQAERQARLISTHNLTPVNRDYRDDDAQRAFDRAQGKVKTSPEQEARAEAKQAEVVEETAAEEKPAPEGAEEFVEK